jgi:hypothetical protein
VDKSRREEEEDIADRTHYLSCELGSAVRSVLVVGFGVGWTLVEAPCEVWISKILWSAFSRGYSR